MIIQELRAEFNEYFQSLDPELILFVVRPFCTMEGSH